MNERKGEMGFMPPFKDTGEKVGNGPYKNTRIDVDRNHHTLIRKGGHLSWDEDDHGFMKDGSLHGTDHGRQMPPGRMPGRGMPPGR